MSRASMRSPPIRASQRIWDRRRRNQLDRKGVGLLGRGRNWSYLPGRFRLGRFNWRSMMSPDQAPLRRLRPFGPIPVGRRIEKPDLVAKCDNQPAFRKTCKSN